MNADDARELEIVDAWQRHLQRMRDLARSKGNHEWLERLEHIPRDHYLTFRFGWRACRTEMLLREQVVAEPPPMYGPGAPS